MDAKSAGLSGGALVAGNHTDTVPSGHCSGSLAVRAGRAEKRDALEWNECSSRPLRFNQPLADGVANQFAAIVQIELAHEIALVGIHRLDA